MKWIKLQYNGHDWEDNIASIGDEDVRRALGFWVNKLYPILQQFEGELDQCKGSVTINVSKARIKVKHDISYNGIPFELIEKIEDKF